MVTNGDTRLHCCGASRRFGFFSRSKSSSEHRRSKALLDFVAEVGLFFVAARGYRRAAIHALASSPFTNGQSSTSRPPQAAHLSGSDRSSVMSWPAASILERYRTEAFRCATSGSAPSSLLQSQLLDEIWPPLMLIAPRGARSDAHLASAPRWPFFLRTGFPDTATMLKRTAETTKAAVSGHQRQRPRRPINKVLTADSGRC